MLPTLFKPTHYSVVRLIKTLTTSPPSISTVHLLHSFIIKSGFKSNPFISTSLSTLYSTLNSITHAHNIFDEIPKKTLVSYTAISRVYSTSNQPHKSLQLILSAFFSGFSLDPIALSIAFSACRSLRALHVALSLHGLVFKAGYGVDAFVMTELVNVYGDSGELALSRKAFDESGVKNVVVWNAIVQQYVKAGFLEKAEGLFREMPIKDVVSWNTMITGFCRVGRYKEALGLFHEMELLGVRTNEVTMGMFLSACAGLGALDTGVWVHAYLERKKMNANGNLDHCLIDMYAKCGSIEKAIQVFRKVTMRRDLYSWTSIICGLAMHGRANDALNLFTQMQEVGVRPDDVTLIGVLSACAHGGLVDEGYKYFRSMEELFGLSPKIEHYGCMVDVLCRMGRLVEASLLIKEMPMEPNAVIWGSLLSACKVYNDVRLGDFVANKLVELDPNDNWARVMMSNLHAGDCNWSGVTRFRKEMKGIGLRKMPGCSSIEVSGEVYEFIAGGNLHTKDAEIRNLLKMMEDEMHAV